jgi:hypothetical protein
MPNRDHADVAPSTEVLLQLAPEPGADPEEAERLNRQLLSELKQHDIEDLVHHGHADAPAGSKGGEILTTGEWLLTISASGGVLATIVGAMRDWLGRRAGANKISLTISGDTIALDRASDAERAALIDAFVVRHSHAQVR